MLPEPPDLSEVNAQESQNRQTGHTQATTTCKASASTAQNIRHNCGGIAMASKYVRQVSLPRSAVCRQSAYALGCLRTEEPALASQAAPPCMMSCPVPSTLAMT